MRASILVLALLGLACGKSLYVPVEAEGAASASAALAAPPAPSIEPSTPSTAPPREPLPDEPEPPPPSPLAKTCTGVSLVIASVNVGKDRVDAVVELRNGSSEHVPLVMPGDGSDSGRRNPTVTFELSPNRVETRYGCGNMNALSARELVTLAPGARQKLDWLSPPTPSRPGRYTLRATYRNDPDSTKLGDTMPGPKADKLIARVRKTVPCTLVSNTVAFGWSGPEPAKGAARCNCQANDPLCSCL